MPAAKKPEDPGKRRRRRKPLRLERKARRIFYKSVHAVLPTPVRRPLRRALKGPPPTAEELAARRRAALARKAEMRRRREARLRTRERSAWIKQETGLERREHSEAKRAQIAAERLAEKAARERRRRMQLEARRRAAWIKQEAGAAKRVEQAIAKRRARSTDA